MKNYLILLLALAGIAYSQPSTDLTPTKEQALTDASNVTTDANQLAWRQAIDLIGVTKSGSFTAANQTAYIVTANATVTDPSPSAGEGYLVFVRNGTATVGGTAYATPGTVIRRVYHSGAWSNEVNTPDDAVAITGGSITGITDLAVADGGTGASNAGDARTNLGLGSISTQDSNNVAITGGDLSGITSIATTDIDSVNGYVSNASASIHPFGADTGNGFGYSTNAGAAYMPFGILLGGSLDADGWNLEDVGDLSLTGSIELGHATDTTLSRAAAGRLAVEGVNVPTISSTDTFTNKTLTSPTINGGTLSNMTSASITGDLTVDTSTLYVDSANNKVGIGTLTPDAGLEIKNTVAGYRALKIPAGSWIVSDDGAGSSITMMSYGSNVLEFGDNNITRYDFYGSYEDIVSFDGTGIQLKTGNTVRFADNSGTWSGSVFAGDQTASGAWTHTGSVSMSGGATITKNNASPELVFTESDDNDSHVVGVDNASNQDFVMAYGVAISGGTVHYRANTSGEVGVSGAPTSGIKLTVNGDSMRVTTAKTPASASATGTQGQIAWDANYIYICTALNTWKRVAIATW